MRVQNRCSKIETDPEIPDWLDPQILDWLANALEIGRGPRDSGDCEAMIDIPSQKAGLLSGNFKLQF